MLVIHQTHHTLADFKAIETSLKALKAPRQSLHLFPELYLTGYPLQDLCLSRDFQIQYEQLIERLDQHFQSLDPTIELDVLMGGLLYEEGQIYNVIFHASAGGKLSPFYRKQLLPSYDIFDETKYFRPGHGPGIFSWQGKKIGLMICEDMWSNHTYGLDPMEQLKAYCTSEGIQLDAVINLSASPYDLFKLKNRLERAKNISANLRCPFFYINRVGGEDEVLFDGQSFVVHGEKTVAILKAFSPDQKSFKLSDLPSVQYKPLLDEQPSKDFIQMEFALQIDERSKGLPTLPPLSDAQYQEIIDSLVFGIQEYASKNKFERFLVGLSGGIDSALVLFLTSLAAQSTKHVEAVFMASRFSSNLSRQLSQQMCERLNIPLAHLPIKFSHSVIGNQFAKDLQSPLEGLADENIQSRLRGLYLYTRSNQTGAMVLNTSNKSELAVGYSTQYGDSVGSISVIGDLYKSEIFPLCRYINTKYGQVIPTEIIDRPPTAELKPDQKDSDSLPPYEILDPILEYLLSYRYGVEQIVAKGFDQQDVLTANRRYQQSEYKRYQFCPVLKIKPKSFGFGRRIPLSRFINS
jgi:NAD+ synthase (glutamine-hydrolysing)